jgi:hypothetical protein
MLTFKGTAIVPPSLPKPAQPQPWARYQPPAPAVEAGTPYADPTPGSHAAQIRTLAEAFVAERRKVSEIADELVFIIGQLRDPALADNPHRPWGEKRLARLEAIEDAALWEMLNVLYVMDQLWNALTPDQRTEHGLPNLLGVPAGEPALGLVLAHIRDGPIQDQAPWPPAWDYPQAFMARLPDELIRLTGLCPF